MGKLITIDQLLEAAGWTVERLAEASGLPAERIEAIAHGRWTPSPRERQRIAQALDVQIDEVSWGHTMDPRNIRYRRCGLKEDF
ncbi:MAG: helix-turn-helix domain-containing protein [Pirellulales bacterium]